jgi:hydrogenase maturation protease
MHLVLDTPSRCDVSRVTPTLIYAVGNPLRSDDGVGPAVVELLRQRIVDPSVELIDGGNAGLEAALEFRNRHRIILIDAADVGAPAGTVRKLVLNARELESRPVHPNSLHTAGLLESLALAAALGGLPRQITLFCVQPGSLDYREGLSEEVRAAIPGLLESVLTAIHEPE